MKFTTYNNIRSKIKTGDIYFTASNTLLGSSIRVMSRSNISHVGIFKVSESRITMLEAQAGKPIQEVYASTVLKEQPIIYLDTEKYRRSKNILDKDIKDFFELMEGQDYDTLGMLLSLIFNIPNRKVFCSEMVAKALKIEMPHLRRGITPTDLYTALYLMR